MTFYRLMTAGKSLEETNVRMNLERASKGDFKGTTGLARQAFTMEGIPFRTEIRINRNDRDGEYHVYMMLRAVVSERRNGTVKTFKLKSMSELKKTSLVDAPVTFKGRTVQGTLTLAPPMKFNQKVRACVPDEVAMNACLKFKKDVLESSYFEATSASGEEHAIHFIRNESKATASLTNYDPQRLAHSLQRCIHENEINQCIEDAIGNPGCDTAFEVLHYFKGLIRGMKENGWSQETIALGEKTIQKHVNYTLQESPSLLEVWMAFDIIEKAQAQGFLKGVYKDIKPFIQEAQTIHDKLKSVWDAKTNRSCVEQLKFSTKEGAMTKALSRKWVKANL